VKKHDEVAVAELVFGLRRRLDTWLILIRQFKMLTMVDGLSPG